MLNNVIIFCGAQQRADHVREYVSKAFATPFFYFYFSCCLYAPVFPCFFIAPRVRSDDVYTVTSEGVSRCLIVLEKSNVGTISLLVETQIKY